MLDKSLRHNYIVNLLDGGFFGFALGFASFVTIIPLFISQFTESALLIGLIPVLHNAGWQLPQLFTANLVSMQKRHKPLVVLYTIHERLPFLAMAGIAWLSSSMKPSFILALTFLMLAWQGFGAGFTANPWQSMVAKIIPSNQRGTFLGLQGSAVNIFFSFGAIISGIVLDRLPSPLDFTICFLIASAWMVFSYISIALTIEDESPVVQAQPGRRRFYKDLISILKKDSNFRWFLSGRIVTQFSVMASAFYIIYIVRNFGITETTAGLLTGILAGTQIIANPLLGWLGDRLGHRYMLLVGAASATLSAMVALLAPSPGWFYLAFILVGISNVAVWTTAMSITMEFGGEAERPAYIGLANSLIAPAAIAAPLIGGWLADTLSYSFTFGISVISGLVTIAIFFFALKDPRVSHRKSMPIGTSASDAQQV